MKKLIPALLLLLSVATFAQNYDDSLYMATVQNDVSLMKDFINKGANVNYVKQKGWIGISLLIAAVKKESVMATKLLIDHGADVNWKDGSKATALIYACNNRNILIVELLLENGADLEYKDAQDDYVVSLLYSNVYGQSFKGLDQLMTTSKIVSLGKFRLESLPQELFRCTQIEELDNALNNIGELPSEIKNLKNLKILTLQGNGLMKIPDELFELENLEVLDLRENPIRVLPDKFDKLKKLKVLLLARCPLLALPPSIFRVQSLEELDLTVTGIKSLPDSISNLKNLKMLIAGANSLEALPESVVLMDSLTFIDLSDNQIKYLSFSPPNLTGIDLSGNKLVDFPYSITQTGKITFISVEDNNLAYIQPQKFVGMESLRAKKGNCIPYEVLSQLETLNPPFIRGTGKIPVDVVD